MDLLVQSLMPQPAPGRLHPRRSLYRHSCCLGLWLLALPGPTHAGAQTSSPEVSSAETLLFETDHLARVEPPAVLVYEFRKVSSVEPGFSDKVQLDVTGSKGKVSATLHFLSGKNRHDLPALEEAHGNPVLLGFLERDISEMKRLTGGSTAYFRKRLRMALAESAQVSSQPITYQGKVLPAQAVRIQPYLDDPMHARFEQYVNKTYTFIVSDQVPGGIFQLRSSLANRGRPQPGTTVAGSGEGGIVPRQTATTPVMEAKASKRHCRETSGCEKQGGARHRREGCRRSAKGSRGRASRRDAGAGHQDNAPGRQYAGADRRDGHWNFAGNRRDTDAGQRCSTPARKHIRSRTQALSTKPALNNRRWDWLQHGIEQRTNRWEQMERQGSG